MLLDPVDGYKFEEEESIVEEPKITVLVSEQKPKIIEWDLGPKKSLIKVKLVMPDPVKLNIRDISPIIKKYERLRAWKSPEELEMEELQKKMDALKAKMAQKSASKKIIEDEDIFKGDEKFDKLLTMFDAL